MHGLVFELDHSQFHEMLADSAREVSYFSMNPGGEAPFAQSAEAGETSSSPCNQFNKVKSGSMMYHVRREIVPLLKSEIGLTKFD